MSARTMNERSISVAHAAISGRALIVGGMMFAIGTLLHPLEHNDAAWYAASLWLAIRTRSFRIPRPRALPFVSP